MTSKVKRRVVSTVTLGVFLLAIIVLTILFGDELIAMVEDPELFHVRTAEMGLTGRLLFVGLTALQVVLAVIPGQIFALAGGYCFGTFQGVLLSLIGIAIGSAIAFCLARFFGLKVITAFYPAEKLQELSFLKESKRQIFATFLVFLIPGIPKDMVTYFMGLTQMRLHIFLTVSLIGRLPGLILSVLSGAALQEKNLTMIIIIVVVCIALFVFGFLFYRRKRRAKQSDTTIGNAEDII